jgi:nicotinate-nucleotide pyrophosphorylase (carboxylating)
MFSKHTERLIDLALEEDIGSGDITSQAMIPFEQVCSAEIIAKDDLVLCGQEIVEIVFKKLDSDSKYQRFYDDGSRVRKGEVLGCVTGKTQSILSGERVCLNFLQRLSAISTRTRRYVDTFNSPTINILDTRKTTPGWRELEKYAVRIGGGVNHRQGLYDAVLIKNNHIDAVTGNIKLAITKCREFAKTGTFIQVEVRDIEELKLALQAKPDGVLLDNMSPQQIRESLELVNQARSLGEKIKVEASGGIKLENIADYRILGLDFISIGALTHSVKAVDICLHYKR